MRFTGHAQRTSPDASDRNSEAAPSHQVKWFNLLILRGIGCQWPPHLTALVRAGTNARNPGMLFRHEQLAATRKRSARDEVAQQGGFRAKNRQTVTSMTVWRVIASKPLCFSHLCAIRTSSCSRPPPNALVRAFRSTPDQWSTSHTSRTEYPADCLPTDTLPKHLPPHPNVDQAWRSP